MTPPSAGGGVLVANQHQAEQIESAWRLCSYGNPRRLSGKWASTFRELVTEIVGHEPPDNFTVMTVADDVAAQVQAAALAKAVTP